MDGSSPIQSRLARFVRRLDIHFLDSMDWSSLGKQEISTFVTLLSYLSNLRVFLFTTTRMFRTFFHPIIPVLHRHCPNLRHLYWDDPSELNDQMSHLHLLDKLEVLVLNQDVDVARSELLLPNLHTLVLNHSRGDDAVYTTSFFKMPTLRRLVLSVLGESLDSRTSQRFFRKFGPQITTLALITVISPDALRSILKWCTELLDLHVVVAKIPTGISDEPHPTLREARIRISIPVGADANIDFISTIFIMCMSTLFAMHNLQLTTLCILVDNNEIPASEGHKLRYQELLREWTMKWKKENVRLVSSVLL
jgi:hypothetical protein